MTRQAILGCTIIGLLIIISVLSVEFMTRGTDVQPTERGVAVVEKTKNSDVQPADMSVVDVVDEAPVERILTTDMRPNRLFHHQEIEDEERRTVFFDSDTAIDKHFLRNK